MSEDRTSFARDDISEWLPEIARWLEEITGHHPEEVLLTDETDLYDLLEMEPTGEHEWTHLPFRDEPKRVERWEATVDAWSWAVRVFSGYGVMLGIHDDTNLVTLAKRTYETRRTGS